MPQIGKLWAGRIFGTNTGNLFAELDPSPEGFSGVLRISDDRFGVAVYAVTGTFDGTAISLSGKPTTQVERIQEGEVTAAGTVGPEGNINGQWTSTIGTGGTFVLFPHNQTVHNREMGPSPERLHIATRTIGAVRLYAKDVEELIGFIGRDFGQTRVVVTYRERGHEISRYASDFQNDLTKLGELRYLKLYIQAPDSFGVIKSVLVELNSDGKNEVRAQGVQESWVIGQSETTASFLKTFQKGLSTSFRVFGGNIYALLLLLTLAALPELSLIKRLIFLVIVSALVWLMYQAHARFIPNVIVYLSPKQPTWIERTAPQALSWIIAASSAVVASVFYGFLKGELSTEWLKNLRIWQ